MNRSTSLLLNARLNLWYIAIICIYVIQDLAVCGYRISIGKLIIKNLVSVDLMKDIESFVCALYGYPKEANVDNVRYLMFQQKYAPKADHDPLDKM